MGESDAHKKTKSRAAGQHGKTEVPLPSGGRLDALTSGGKRATEVERSGNPKRLGEAAQRLKEASATQRVLQVPQKDMGKATQAMKEAGVPGTVKNIGGTQRRSVRKQ